MDFGKVKLFGNENINKLRLKTYTWDELIGDKTILYKILCDLIFSKENLFYYASQKESTRTLVDTRKYIEKLIDKGIIDSMVEDIFCNMGWKKEKLDITNTIFQGDLGEYLMCILLDRITEIDTIISKVSLKTSPKMPSFGNDNIFYDYEKEILYYGEAKFYENVERAIEKAMNSLKKHAEIEEIRYIRSHDNVIIAENGDKREKIVEEFEEKMITEITVKSIFFIINDDIYLKDDYERSLIKYFKTIEKINAKSEEIIMVFLPVLSKKEFLKYFKEGLF